MVQLNTGGNKLKVTEFASPRNPLGGFGEGVYHSGHAGIAGVLIGSITSNLRVDMILVWQGPGIGSVMNANRKKGTVALLPFLDQCTGICLNLLPQLFCVFWSMNATNKKMTHIRGPGIPLAPRSGPTCSEKIPKRALPKHVLTISQLMITGWTVRVASKGLLCESWSWFPFLCLTSLLRGVMTVPPKTK